MDAWNTHDFTWFYLLPMGYYALMGFLWASFFCAVPHLWAKQGFLSVFSFLIGIIVLAALTQHLESFENWYFTLSYLAGFVITFGKKSHD